MSPRVARFVDYALVVLGIVILFVVPHRISGDGVPRFETLERLVNTGVLASPRYSVLVPLFASPLYFVGRALRDPQGITALLNVLLFTGSLFFLARELREEVSPRTRRACLLLLVYASMFPNHVQVFYGEVLTALTVTLGVFWIARGKPVRGWAVIIVGAVNTPAAIVGVGAIALRAAMREKRWLHLAGPVLAFALTRAESIIVHGSALSTGYEGDAGYRTVLPYSGLPGFSYPFFLGVLAIVLSFGKGLVFFTPGLFVSAASRSSSERLRWIQGTLIAFVIGLVLVYARWWAWYGGSFWGPRFFLIASVPACIALATRLEKPEEETLRLRIVLGGALLLSFWVGANGLVFDQTGLDLCWKNDYANEALCHFVPEMSVLWHPFVDFGSAVPEKSRPLAIGVCALFLAVALWVGRDLWKSLFARSR